MDARNLAIVFGPVVFGEDEITQGDLLSMQPMKVRYITYLFPNIDSCKDSVMEGLIENAHVLFDEQLPPSSPPLPPAPAGEPVPEISYGSSHTTITLPQSEEAQVADFTPQLPPRPTSSIHPSARSNPPMSPPQLSVDLLGDSTPIPSTPSLALPPSAQVSTDETEQPAQVQVVPNASATEVGETALNQFQVSVSQSLASAYDQQQGQEAVESVPETPLTASSRASNSSESRTLI